MFTQPCFPNGAADLFEVTRKIERVIADRRAERAVDRSMGLQLSGRFLQTRARFLDSQMSGDVSELQGCHGVVVEDAMIDLLDEQ